jgi:hypothetical protein
MTIDTALLPHLVRTLFNKLIQVTEQLAIQEARLTQLNEELDRLRTPSLGRDDE